MGLSVEQRVLIARIGGLALHASRDSREVTAPARRAFLATFEEAVDPLHQLPESERLRRATLLRRSYMAKLALKSARARAARKRGGDA